MTSSLVMQLLAGSRIIEVNQSIKEDRALFSGAQKVRRLAPPPPSHQLRRNKGGRDDFFFEIPPADGFSRDVCLEFPAKLPLVPSTPSRRFFER